MNQMTQKSTSRFGLRTPIRLVAILFALAMVAAACGGGDGDDVAVEAEATTTTEAVETTTTTTQPADTTTTTTTTEAPPVGDLFPLTGEPIGDADADHPAVVVKISNNDATARAATDGLDEADIVYEERIEVEATRFASVFHSSLPEQVGSVRSGRTSDVQIVANLNRPVFGFSGANEGVHNQLRAAEADGILLRASADFGDNQFSRISDFGAPNNLVADVSRLVNEAPDGEPPAPVFDYGNNAVELGSPSPGVRIAARVEAQYVWSESDGGYLRFQGGNAHVTRDGIQITPVNVIVLTTQYVPSQVDRSSVDAVTIGEGEVVVYSNGARVVGTWTREFPRDPFTLTTADGEIIGLAPGQTWVSLTPAGTATQMTSVEAEELVE